MTKDTKTVAIIHHHFGPYHKARIEAAARAMTPDWRVVGVELSPTSEVYAWDPVTLDTPADHRTVCDVDSRSLSRSQLRNAIEQSMRDVQPDVIAVAGWSDNGAIEFTRWAIDHGIARVIMSESNQNDFARSGVKEWIKRRFVGAFSTALVGGSLAKQYLVNLGMRSDRIQMGYDAVDNQAYAAAEASSIQAIRDRFEINGPAFLCSCRLVPKKNVGTALRAFARYRSTLAHDHGWSLVIAGDGPENESLRELAVQLGVADQIRWTGFCQAEEMKTLYHAAAALVHVSTREQWGLVVNEAMAAGRPVIVSSACGCAADLVAHGENGFVVGPDDVDGIAEAMRLIADDRSLAVQMGDAGRRRIADWGTQRYATGMRLACEQAVEAPRGCGWLSRVVVSVMR